jgi:hypothetical protein
MVSNMPGIVQKETDAAKVRSGPGSNPQNLALRDTLDLDIASSDFLAICP